MIIIYHHCFHIFSHVKWHCFGAPAHVGTKLCHTTWPRLGSFADQQFLHRDFLELADEYMMKAALLGDAWMLSLLHGRFSGSDCWLGRANDIPLHQLIANDFQTTL